MARHESGQPLNISRERLQAALASLQRWVDAGLTPGVAAVVGRDGRLAGEFYAGTAEWMGAGGERLARAIPVTAETLFCLTSLTNVYTACAAMTLVEDGLLALDEPLVEWLPEITEEDRVYLTLRRLLTHTTGLPLDLGPEEHARIGPTPTREAIYGQYARLRLICPPGSQVRYSNINFALLALLVERVHGQPFTQVLRRRVLEPLGLAQTFLPPPERVWDRLARVDRTPLAGAIDEPFNSSWWRRLALPYAGAYATARDVARFLTACLADLAIPNFLVPATLDLMTRSHTLDLAGGIPGLSVWGRADWGLGFELRGDKRLHPFGDLNSPETFGHLSLAGGMAWADPQTRLVCVVLINRTLATEPTPLLTAFCRFSNAVAASLLD